MKRFARVNGGDLRVIITGDELIKCKDIDGKKQYPVKFFGYNDFLPVTIQNGKNFEEKTGENYNDIEDWSF